MKVMNFQTDGSATSGTGVEANSGETSVRLPPIRILALKQISSGTAANDASWALWVSYKDTGQLFIAESLNPVNDGGIKLGPSGITIGGNTSIIWKWSGQASAASNTLEVFYETL